MVFYLTLKSLDNEFKKSCTNFDATFFHNDLSNVDANLFFYIENIAIYLSNMLMSVFKIFEFVKCYRCISNSFK